MSVPIVPAKPLLLGLPLLALLAVAGPVWSERWADPGRAGLWAARLAGSLRSRSGSRVTAALLVTMAAGLWVQAASSPAVAGAQGAAALALLGVTARWWSLHAPPR